MIEKLWKFFVTSHRHFYVWLFDAGLIGSRANEIEGRQVIDTSAQMDSAKRRNQVEFQQVFRIFQLVFYI